MVRPPDLAVKSTARMDFLLSSDPESHISLFWHPLSRYSPLLTWKVLGPAKSLLILILVGFSPDLLPALIMQGMASARSAIDFVSLRIGNPISFEVCGNNRQKLLSPMPDYQEPFCLVL
jgi:hypothetical protein